MFNKMKTNQAVLLFVMASYGTVGRGHKVVMKAEQDPTEKGGSVSEWHRAREQVKEF